MIRRPRSPPPLQAGEPALGLLELGDLVEVLRAQFLEARYLVGQLGGLGLEAVGTLLQGVVLAAVVAQLAFEYCSTLVDDTTGIRDAFWPGFPFGATEATAFSVANRALLIDPLVEQVVGLNLPTQPVPGDVELELNALLDRLIASPGENTNAIAKGTCAAALGSAAMLVQ